MSTKAEYAISLHDQGYNCAQAVACTFCKEFGVDEQEMFRIAEGFGLGMGMMEMCGTRLSVVYCNEATDYPLPLFYHFRGNN